MGSILDHHVTMRGDEDVLAGLDVEMPDPAVSAAIIARMLRKKAEQEKEKQKLEKQRERNAKKMASMAEEDHGAKAIAQMAELQERLGLDMQAALEEYQETQHSLFPVALPPEPAAVCEPDYMEGVTGALSALGVDASFLPAREGGEEGLGAMLMAEGVRCGFVQNEALRRGSVDAPTVEYLVRLLSRSADMEVAGAAFVTLLSLLGDPSLQRLTLDGAYGLPPEGSPIYSSLPRPCRFGSLPSIRFLYDALVVNGYSPSGPAGHTPRKQQQQQQGAAAGDAGAGGQEAPVLRVQAVKLVLQTTVAVCRYCQLHPKLCGAVMDREALADFALAVARLGLDPCERLLLDDLDDAAEALLGAFEEADWQRKMPQMAARLGELAQSHTAHLKMLKRLPVGTPRGLALQQLSGALLLERIIPARGAAASAPSAVARRRDGMLDPAAVIQAQPWFDNPKGLVTNATSGGAGAAPKGGYHISQVELLLKVCNLLLWPHMQRYGEGSEDTPLTPEFLHRWCGSAGFLERIYKSIKSLALEDTTVKATANFMQIEYQEVVKARDTMQADD